MAYLGRLRLGCLVRKDAVIYWTFNGIPHWLITKRIGWFVFSVIDSTTIGRIPGKLSELLIHVFNTFYCADNMFSFNHTGFRLGPSGRVQRSGFGGMIQDYEAYQECFNFKGASGTVCCLKCLNVIRGRDISGHSCLHDIKTAKLEDCILRSANDLYAAADELDALAQQGLSITAFKKQEQMRGLTYNPRGLLWYGPLRHVVNPVDGAIYDWFHCIIASGGPGSYHINALVGKILDVEVVTASGCKTKPFTLKTLDDFMGDVITNQGEKPPKLQIAYNPEPGTQLKAMGNEVYAIASGLWLFVLLALVPAGLLPKHVECFAMLMTILDLLMHDDVVFERMDVLRHAISAHFDGYMELYTDLFKPKLHFTLHIPDMLLILGKNWNCMSPEAFHKVVKSYARNCMGPRRHAHVIRNMASNHFKVFMDSAWTKEVSSLSSHGGSPAGLGSDALRGLLPNLLKDGIIFVERWCSLHGFEATLPACLPAPFPVVVQK